MNYQNGLLRLVLLCSAFGAYLCFNIEAVNGDPKGKKLIRVNGEDVYESDFDISIKDMIKKIKSKEISAGEKQKQINDLRAKSINEQIQVKRLEQEAKANGIEITSEEINGYVTAKASESFMSAEEFKDGLVKYEGMSEEDIEIRFKRILEKERLIDLKFKDKLNVSDKERDAYMQKKPQIFKRRVPESISLEYIEILFAEYSVSDEHKKQVEKICNEIQKKALQGNSFYDLVKQYSQTSLCRVKKGITTVLPGNSSFPFTEVLSMNKGQVSDVIDTQGKYIIFRVANRVRSYQMTDLEIKDKATELILKGKRRYLLQRYKLSLLNGASVELLDENSGFKDVAPKYRADFVKPITQ